MSRLIVGKNAVREILSSGEPEKVYLQSSNKELLDIAKRKGVKVEIVNKEKLDSLTKENHQGAVALAPDFKYYQINELVSDENTSLIVILDGLKDPHNLGAILRTCEATNVDGVIIPKNRSVRLSDTVSKTSTGAMELVKVSEVTNLSQTIDYLKKNGYWIVGAEHEDKSTNYWDLDYNMKIALVIGSEGEGISRLVKENCDFLVDIPMMGKINSLNASVSTALIIYEIRRKQRK